MTTHTQKHTFHVHGMHCKSCELMVESELKELPYIEGVNSTLSDHSVEVSGHFGAMTPDQIAEELTIPLKRYGYTVSVGRQRHAAKWKDLRVAAMIAAAFVVAFIVLQKMGIVGLVGAGEVTYGTAFVVGIVASLSTCMAVVGGLVLSMSATFAKEGDKVRPQMMFHAGRLISFFLLGGVIGSIGAAFTLSTAWTFTLSLIIGLVMLILGLNLLDLFYWTRRLQPSMPRFIARHAYGVSKLNHTLTPALVGIATFFLPCGFTQSMQLYTLSTGDFLTGGLTMLAFALGTLPVLALVSFSSFSIQKSSKAGVFFKTAGLIVIVFALFNLINSLVVIGIVPPLFNI